MENTIIEITYDFTKNAELPEWARRKVGEVYEGKVCREIKEHRAQGEGDKWYYDIFYSDGSIERTFNPNNVVFSKEKP